MKNKIKSSTNKIAESIENKYPMHISVCLEEYIDSLHANFIVTKDGDKRGSSVLLTFHGHPIAAYDLRGAKPKFWIIMERFWRAKSFEQSKMDK